MKMLKTLTAIVLSVTAMGSHANNLIDVGVGATPDYDPARGTQWNLSSTCVDINEAGEAACQTFALGPTYGCGFRNIKTCGSKVVQVSMWDGAALRQVSAEDANYDVPLVINNQGEIGGYRYVGQVYPHNGGNGRIWTQGQTPKALAGLVVSLNDNGDYVMQRAYSSGGKLIYTGSAHLADDSEITFPGDVVRPIAINNNRTVVGAQILQSFVNELSTSTGNEVPEVSGVGWLVDDELVSSLGVNEQGLLDVDRDTIWQTRYMRPIMFTNYTTSIGDINEYGDFVYRSHFSSKLYSGYYCSHEGETKTGLAKQPTVPWKCHSADSFASVNYSSRAFYGINNIGDAVGVHTPPYSGYHTPPSFPKVWLRNVAGSRDEYDPNDLLPEGSDYQVITVNDINDNRQIVGTCLDPAGEKRGCIIEIQEPAVPDDNVKPLVRLDSLTNGDVISSDVNLLASVWDDWSRVNKVIFKVDKQRLGIDSTRPFSAQLTLADFAQGEHKIKVIGFDNEGNRRAKTVKVSFQPSIVVPPDPDPGPGPDPTPPPGEEVEGEGSITAIGVQQIELGSLVIQYNASTSIKLNDVSEIAVGLPVQYKGVVDSNGIVHATDLEVN